MIDIVERLQRWEYSLANDEADMVIEAVAEIERLRAQEGRMMRLIKELGGEELRNAPVA